MRVALCLALACASLAGAIVNRQAKFDTYFKDNVNPLIVGRLADVENAVGTTWHSLNNNSPSDVSGLLQEWQDAGIHNFRSYFNWDEIETKPTEFTYTKTNGVDNAILIWTAMKAKGINPYATLVRGNTLYHPGCTIDSESGRLIVAKPFDGKNHPELDYFSPTKFAAFCGNFATRFKGYGTWYELGNEPYNFGFADYYGGNPSNGLVWGDHYANYYLQAAKAIRAVQPGAKFILGGVEDVALDAVKSYLPKIAPYVNAAYDDYMDPGPEGTYAYAIKPYKDLAAAYGIPEVWITEAGWVTPKPGTVSPEKHKQTSVQGQAKYLSRGLFFYPIRAGVKVYGQWTWTRHADGSYEAGDIQQTAKTAYNNVHYLTQGSVVDVPIAQYKGASIAYQFANSAKRLYLVSWIRMKQADNFPKKTLNVKITFPKATAVKNVFGHDILKSVTTTRSFTVTQKDVLIQNTWVCDYPSIVEINLP
jgi:hypothetical protein